MNWTAIITFLAIITGIYFLWSYLSKKEANPTTQKAFENTPLDAGELLYLGQPVGDPVPLITDTIVANELPAIDPQQTTNYTTNYDIVVEAPEIPELDTSELMKDILEQIDVAKDAPIVSSPPKRKSTSYTPPKAVMPTGGITKGIAESAVQAEVNKASLPSQFQWR